MPNYYDPLSQDNIAPVQANPYEDRITAILNQRAQPMQYTQDQTSLASEAAQHYALAGRDRGVQQILEQVIRNPQIQNQDRQLESAQGLYQLFEQKRAMGDKQAQNVSDVLDTFTSDPEARGKMLEWMHNLPEQIDASNKNKLYTLFARGKRELGIQTDFERNKVIEDLKIQGLRNQLSTSKGTKPQSALGKLAADHQAGLIDDTTYKAMVDKQTGRVGSKPLPVGALKMQNEALDVIGTASSINDRMQNKIDLIDNKKLVLGPLSNPINRGRNLVGMSTEESRNLASFKSDLEKMRNDSLRLNKGVQTEGDAQRAWNEILENINDEDLVKQRLQEVQTINQRAVDLRKMEVDTIRQNYGLAPLDTSGFEAPGKNRLPPDAVNELINDPSPEAMAEFDEVFGEGAAQSILEAQ